MEVILSNPPAQVEIPGTGKSFLVLNRWALEAPHCASQPSEKAQFCFSSPLLNQQGYECKSTTAVGSGLSFLALLI